MHHRTLRPLAVLVVATASLLFGGCATASKPTAMVASVSAAKKNPHSVAVSVTGDRKP